MGSRLDVAGTRRPQLCPDTGSANDRVHHGWYPWSLLCSLGSVHRKLVVVLVAAGYCPVNTAVIAMATGQHSEGVCVCVRYVDAWIDR